MCFWRSPGESQSLHSPHDAEPGYQVLTVLHHSHTDNHQAPFLFPQKPTRSSTAAPNSSLTCSHHVYQFIPAHNAHPWFQERRLQRHRRQLGREAYIAIHTRRHIHRNASRPAFAFRPRILYAMAAFQERGLQDAASSRLCPLSSPITRSHLI
jgi:hypothetical protein